MNWETTPIPGVRVMTPRVARDDRGEFVKTFHQGMFVEAGLTFDLAEEFFSISRRDVVRGMHFHAPPYAHAKLVTCLGGQVLDVLVDLRIGPNYGRSWSTELSAANRQVLYIPDGVAHGFLALTQEALVHYKTTTVHKPDYDCGVRWDSFGFAWPVQNPVLAMRDRSFPILADLVSPFRA